MEGAFIPQSNPGIMLRSVTPGDSGQKQGTGVRGPSRLLCWQLALQYVQCLTMYPDSPPGSEVHFPGRAAGGQSPVCLRLASG